MVELQGTNPLQDVKVRFKNYCVHIQQVQRVKEKLHKSVLHLLVAKTSFFYGTMQNHIQQDRLKKNFQSSDGHFFSPILLVQLCPDRFLPLLFLTKLFERKTHSYLNLVRQEVENFFQSEIITFYKVGIDKMPKKREKLICNNDDCVLNK